MTKRFSKLGLSIPRQRRLTTQAGRVILVFLLTACSPAIYGSLKGSPEVTRLFENHQILPDYQYYVYGFQRVPYAIVGIHRDYTLNSKIWERVTLTPTLLNQLMYRMDVVYHEPPKGAWIVTAEGARVGIWYSSVYAATVETRPDNKLMIVPPKSPDLSVGP